MNQHQPTDNKSAANTEALTDKQTAELSDKEKQAEYEKAYLAQLRQLQCPGCGETELF